MGTAFLGRGVRLERGAVEPEEGAEMAEIECFVTCNISMLQQRAIRMMRLLVCSP